MLQSTFDRLAPIVPPENIMVITGGAHAAAVARQVPEIPELNIVVEPGPRGTGPAIGLGAALIARKDPDAIMGSFAADHYVSDTGLFQRTVLAAAEVADRGYLVTIGITPTYPETGYGYIRVGEKLEPAQGLDVYTAAQFKEKPDLETARSYVDSGEYLWNASMFVWKASTLLEEMQRLLPDLYQTLMILADAWDRPDRDDLLQNYWPQLQDVTIDHGIMEHTERVAVVPASFGWTDLGDWHSLAELMTAVDGQNVVVSGHHLEIDTHSTLVFGKDRIVATLGVDNLVIVDTDDVLLVCSRSRAQDVRKIVQQLKDRDDHTLT
jgi:mannose-1-phosphate guanylyltransferase